MQAALKLAFVSFLAAMALSFRPAPATSTATAPAPSPNDIIGVWMPSEGTSYIRIFKEKGKERYHGKVVWLKEPNDEKGQPKTDPEGKAILNMLNLRNFVFEDGEWVDGTIYDPKGGSTYYCTIEMKNEDKLEVRGSVDPFGLVGRTDTWVRMKGQ